MESIIYKTKSSLDKMSLIKTLIIGFLVPSVMSFFAIKILFYGMNKSGGYVLAVLATVLFLLLIYGFLHTPKSYILTNSALIIKRFLGDKVINLPDINEIREFNKDDRRGMYRKFGAEGLFGNFGIYSSKIHKIFNVYTSRDTNWVLIVNRSRKKYVISPDNIELIDKVKGIKNKIYVV